MFSIWECGFGNIAPNKVMLAWISDSPGPDAMSCALRLPPLASGFWLLPLPSAFPLPLFAICRRSTAARRPGFLSKPYNTITLFGVQPRAAVCSRPNLDVQLGLSGPWPCHWGRPKHHEPVARLPDGAYTRGQMPGDKLTTRLVSGSGRDQRLRLPFAHGLGPARNRLQNLAGKSK